MSTEEIRDALDVALWSVVENQRTNGGNGGGLVGIMAALRNAILSGSVDLGDGLVLMVGELAASSWECEPRCWQEGGPHGPGCRETRFYSPVTAEEADDE